MGFPDDPSTVRTCPRTALKGRAQVLQHRTDFNVEQCSLFNTLTDVSACKQTLTNRMASAGDRSFKFLTYQLPTVGYWPTVAMTGNGELGFDSGEGA